MRTLNRGRAPQGIRLVGLLAVLAAVGAIGASASHSSRSVQPLRAYVSPQLVVAARSHPAHVFHVILQGSSTAGERAVVSAVRREATGMGVGLGRRLGTIDGASAGVTGHQLIELARTTGIAAITLDRPVHLTGAITNSQTWPTDTRVRQTWPQGSTKGPTPPAIAIVDSGVQANRADFGNGTRVIDQTTIVSSGTNSPGDGYGHGTFVAGIAAGSAAGYGGAAPNAPIVSIDVLNDQGVAMTSDVIAACDWIVAHKTADNIGVANFSLHSGAPGSVFWDPLDRAVEKLWFDKIVVVAAAGNYGSSSGPSGVLYAPGNDPFVITVGADDTGGTASTNNDSAAPWSAWGYTYDGFAKPEISAPGRYMIGPIPAGSTLATTRASSIVAPGYIQLSGTSFAAPIVSGAAAYILSLHPTWTPDQVKGALMVTADNEPNAVPGSVGVGLVNASAAGALTYAPNPNLAIDKFVGPDPNGGSIPVFNTASWSDAARSDASWSDASWSDAAWATASWSDASWSDASWSDAAWATSAYGTASWSDASWSDASWSDLSQADGSLAESGPHGAHR